MSMARTCVRRSTKLKKISVNCMAAPASPDRGKVFTVEAFDIKVEERQAICPSGRPVVTVVGCARRKTGKVDYRFEWNSTLCGVCPRRAECIAATQTHRTLVVSEYHTLLQGPSQGDADRGV